MERYLTDEDVRAVAEAVYSRFEGGGCPVFNKKQIGTLRVAANTLRVGMIAFISGMGTAGAGLLFWALFHYQ